MTDHIVEAERLSDLMAMLRDGISPASAQVAMAGAQVHATLALVAATRAQTLVLERMGRKRQTRTVGL